MKNLIFLTMSRETADINCSGIYPDLLRMFRKEGWNIYIVMPYERSLGRQTELVETDGFHLLGVKTLNLQKTNIIEKGVGQLLLEYQYKVAIKKYLKGVKFDLITYSTPPITFTNVVKYLKKENPNAISYLQLKDIFPQNAVDIGMMSKGGVKGLLYKFFRNKEKQLYAASDFIGCMSPANVEYVLKHNTEINPFRVEVAPNSIELQEKGIEPNQVKAERSLIRSKYNLPTDKPIFIYGGNLGKPQGIPFLIDCLNANSFRADCHFVVIGTGTELQHLQVWYETNKQRPNFNVTVMKGLPKADYDLLVKHCDAGLIFLDHRFTIPNYPSRLLSYLENKMPVLCATDPNTDIGRIAEENGYGYWCESNSVEAFTAILNKMISADRKSMGEKGYRFLKENYTVENTFNAIKKHFNENNN